MRGVHPPREQLSLEFVVQGNTVPPHELKNKEQYCLLIVLVGTIHFQNHENLFPWTARRIQGTHIRDCTASHNNRVPRFGTLCAIATILKIILEHLYLVAGLGTLGSCINLPNAPTPPPLIDWLFLDFRAIFFANSPSFFLVSTIRQVIWSPGTLRSLDVWI